MAKKGLGKGLGAIFGEDIIKESENEAVKAAVRRKKAAAAEEGSAETVGGESYRQIDGQGLR